jgi:hypothetical protein
MRRKYKEFFFFILKISGERSWIQSWIRIRIKMSRILITGQNLDHLFFFITEKGSS